MFRSKHYLAPFVASTSAFASSSTRSFCAGEVQPAVAQHYDLIVVGGGSGGLAAAKRSAEYGKKVCIIEHNAWGGTCVNVGCVPKKIMYNASHIQEIINTAGHLGFSIPYSNFDWGNLKRSRDVYIGRLNKIYAAGLDKLHIDRIENEGYATFSNTKTASVSGSKQKHCIIVGNKTFSADHVVIAVGGTPNSLGVSGENLSINSDGFFDLTHQPKKCAVIGAGYIAVELAGVLNTLGTKTSLFVRGGNALRSFDTMLSSALHSTMNDNGITIRPGSIIKKLRKQEEDGTVTICLEDGTEHRGYDCIITATGRHPVTNRLNLPSTIDTLPSGHIVVDEFQNTSLAGVYCLGDACNKNIDLTPMAIAAGRKLGDRLFGGNLYKNSKADYTLVPTVVFSHPPIGTIGLTETEAITKHGQENIKIYTSSFVNLWYGPWYNGEPGVKPVSKYKLITLLPSEKVIGLHIIGDASDEVLQGFAVAMKMGATKSDFDSCIAIHPTAAEELVTLAPWGKAPTRTTPSAE